MWNTICCRSYSVHPLRECTHTDEHCSCHHSESIQPEFKNEVTHKDHVVVFINLATPLQQCSACINKQRGILKRFVLVKDLTTSIDNKRKIR